MLVCLVYKFETYKYLVGTSGYWPVMKMLCTGHVHCTSSVYVGANKLMLLVIIIFLVQTQQWHVNECSFDTLLYFLKFLGDFHLGDENKQSYSIIYCFKWTSASSLDKIFFFLAACFQVRPKISCQFF